MVGAGVRCLRQCAPFECKPIPPSHRYRTELGQLLDTKTAPPGDVDLSRFSIEQHALIVKYKTAYYSFYIPVALAFIMAGIKARSGVSVCV